MAGENLRLWIIFADVPDGSGNQCHFHCPQCLEDAPTLQTGFEFIFQVEWVWLNSCPPAIDMTFQNPTFAPGTDFEFW